MLFDPNVVIYFQATAQIEYFVYISEFFPERIKILQILLCTLRRASLYCHNEGRQHIRDETHNREHTTL